MKRYSLGNNFAIEEIPCGIIIRHWTRTFNCYSMLIQNDGHVVEDRQLYSGQVPWENLSEVADKIPENIREKMAIQLDSNYARRKQFVRI